MSTRPFLKPYKVINAGSMAASITSSVTIINEITKVSYSYAWSAGSTPVGSVSVQVSNDFSQDAGGATLNAGTWNDLPLAGTVAISGSSGNGMIDIDEIAAYAIRFVYTRVSGSGTLNVTIAGKVS